MGEILMSKKECDRYHILQKCQEKQLSLKRAAELLQLSYRQVKRLNKKFLIEGAKGLISKKRRGPSNRAYSEELKAQVMTLLRGNYIDFGPQLASEKLEEVHGIKISRETLRRWMIAEKIWSAKREKREIHQRRVRRSCEGELIQADGSHHDWFEGRGPKCTLLVAIDDATSAIRYARFEEEETTDGYFTLFHDYFKNLGLPRALYVDRSSIFKVNHGKKNDGVTQFKRAMNELDVEIIYARSPQAKGRVERSNRTLQDRLVKELRLKQISDIETANRFLSEFLESHNRKFAKTPASPFNAHRPLDHNQDLNRILCKKEERKISKDLEMSYEGTIYQIDRPKTKFRLANKKVAILTLANGAMELWLDGKRLKYKPLHDVPYEEPKMDVDRMVAKWERATRPRKAWKEHPWKQQKMVVNFP